MAKGSCCTDEITPTQGTNKVYPSPVNLLGSLGLQVVLLIGATALDLDLEVASSSHPYLRSASVTAKQSSYVFRLETISRSSNVPRGSREPDYQEVKA